MDITKTILSDPINKWIFKSAQKEVYLVGGYVRDLLCGHKSKDRDFVVKKNAKRLATEAAKKFNGRCIALKPETVYRVVLKHKIGINKFQKIVDFSSLHTSINNDLKERDFTVNAIAWNPEEGIIDPFDGRKDLNCRIIKAVRKINLAKDPLRTIRAYRIAAEMGFRISDNTREYIKRYSKGLSKVSEERITEEVFKILAYDRSVSYLTECYHDSVLENIFFQRDVKNNNRLYKNVKLLKLFDVFIKKNSKEKINGKNINTYLREEISQGLNRRGLLRLTIILSDISILSSRIKISNVIHKGLRDINNGIKISTGAMTRKKLFNIFYSSDERILESAILLSFLKRKRFKEIIKRGNEFIKAKNKRVLNGTDIKKILKIKQGTRVGEIIMKIMELQFKGIISKKREARKYILSNFT